MREIFNFLNWEKKKKKKEGNIEVSKIFNFGNLKTFGTISLEVKYYTLIRGANIIK